MSLFVDLQAVLPASIETHIPPKLSSPVRIQEYGVGIFQKAFTKSALKKALKKGLVTVNSQIASTATYIYGGEEIVLHVPAVKVSQKELILPLSVLYEDDYLAVIEKPAGILVSGNSFMTVANALPQNLRESTLPDTTRPWPIHRLDYPTTGVLLVGKTNSSIRLLSKLFEKKKIEKIYMAVTIGSICGSGLIEKEIDGRNAASHYEVCQSVASERFKSLNLVMLTPHTGRRHQLRKHLASINSPILGDRDYGIGGLVLKGKGLYLHAHSLRFEHPFTKQEIFVASPLPKKYGKIIPSRTGTVV